LNAPETPDVIIPEGEEDPRSGRTSSTKPRASNARDHVSTAASGRAKRDREQRDTAEMVGSPNAVRGTRPAVR